MTDVGIPATRIRPLLNAGLVSIVFSTNSSTYYSLVGRTVIKEALGRKEEFAAAPSAKPDIPDGLFECIIGYDDLFIRSFRFIFAANSGLVSTTLGNSSIHS